LAAQDETAIFKHAVYNHPQFGKILAYEVDGYSSLNLMDDANIPCLLSLPYLLGENMARFNNGQAAPIIANTRKFVLSEYNPFFFKGKAAEGTGGPHIGLDMIWPMSIVMRGLTSNNDAEIKTCIDTLVKTHGGKGFMHESFHKDDPSKFTRAWFAWANTIFGEFIWKVYKERPHLV
jgi:meiotically up-regulated gene 157 (Mug157) protein